MKQTKAIVKAFLALLIIFSVISGCEQSISENSDELNSHEAEDMSTEHLLSAILESDILANVRAFNNIQQAFEDLRSKYAELRFFMEREDASALLLSKYLSIDPIDLYGNLQVLQIELNVFTLSDLEILLSQYDILDQLNEEHLLNVAQEALSKYELKQTSDVYGRVNTNYSVWLMARVLQKKNQLDLPQEQKEVDELQNFLDNYHRFVSDSTVNHILQQTKNAVSK